MHPALQRMNLFDFHPVALCTPILLWCLYFVETNQPKMAILAGILSITCKQDAGVAVVCIGIYQHLYLSRKWGTILSIVGIVSTVVALRIIQYFGNATDQPYLQLYEHLVTNSHGEPLPPLHIIINLIRSLLSHEVFTYCVLLWLPLGMLPLCNFQLIFISSPLYLMNILSVRPHMKGIDFHYNALILPFLVYGCCVSIAKVEHQTRRLLLIGSLTSAAITWVFLSPAADPWYESQWIKKPDYARLLYSIPSSASVTASSSMVPHLSHRRYIYVFPNPFQRVAWGATRQALREQYGTRAKTLSRHEFYTNSRVHPVDYVVIDIADAPFPIGPLQYEQYVRYMLSNPFYEIIARSSTLVILRFKALRQTGLTMPELPEPRGG
jgi:uncharacterized membrane protein